MLKAFLTAVFMGVVCGMFFVMAVIVLNLHPKTLPQAQQIAAECPPGLAEQAAKKDAVHAKAQADFEALKKGSK